MSIVNDELICQESYICVSFTIVVGTQEYFCSLNDILRISKHYSLAFNIVFVCHIIDFKEAN